MGRATSLVIAGLVVVSGLASPVAATIGPGDTSRVSDRARDAGALTQVQGPPDTDPGCTPRLVDGNGRDNGSADDGETAQSILQEPWVESVSLEVLYFDFQDRTETFVRATVQLNRSPLESEQTVDIAVRQAEGRPIIERSVTIEPTTDDELVTVAVSRYVNARRAYVELSLDDEVVRTHRDSPFAARMGIRDVSLGVTTEGLGVRGQGSVTIQPSLLDEPLNHTLQVVDGQGTVLRSQRLSVPDDSADEQSLTRQVRFRAMNVDRVVFHVVDPTGTTHVLGVWHNPSPAAGVTLPNGSPVPDVGALDWSRPTNGLDPLSIAYLFAGDDEGTFQNQTAFRTTYDKNRSATMEVAAGSDVHYARPPATAREWTRNAFSDLQPGGRQTSVYPIGADIVSGEVIKEAHVTTFGITPSTILHRAAGQTRRYVAPTGRVSALADYRVTLPETATYENVTDGDRRTLWCVASENVTTQFTRDGRVRGATPNQTAVFTYSFDANGSMTETTFRLRTEIEVTVGQLVQEANCSDGGDDGAQDGAGGDASGSEGGNEDATGATGSGASAECAWEPVRNSTAIYRTTVEDQLPVTIYRLEASVRTAQYPDGFESVAVYFDGPWHSLQVASEDSARVRGVWRYYTTRDRTWDYLVRSGGPGNRSAIHSPALPVAVHAYPSQIGPVVENQTLRITERWGDQRQSPRQLGSHVEIVAEQPVYNATWGMAVRGPRIQREQLSVQGIVGNTSASVRLAPVETQRIRDANLTVRIVSANDERAIVEVTLRDPETGRPIILADPPSGTPFKIREGEGDPRDGYLIVNGQRMVTDTTGTVRVTIREAGQIDARYVPEGWVGADPAYTSARDTVKWVPQATLWYWVDLALQLFMLAIPLLLVWYIGRRLGNVIDYDRI